MHPKRFPCKMAKPRSMLKTKRRTYFGKARENRSPVRYFWGFGALLEHPASGSADARKSPSQRLLSYKRSSVAFEARVRIEQCLKDLHFTLESMQPTAILFGDSQRRKVGASGFEPPTSASRTLRADQAALRPVTQQYSHSLAFGQIGLQLRIWVLGRECYGA